MNRHIRSIVAVAALGAATLLSTACVYSEGGYYRGSYRARAHPASVRIYTDYDYDHFDYRDHRDHRDHRGDWDRHRGDRHRRHH